MEPLDDWKSFAWSDSTLFLLQRSDGRVRNWPLLVPFHRPSRVLFLGCDGTGNSNPGCAANKSAEL